MTKPACLWKRCPDCEDWYCNFHHKHVYECGCENMESMLDDDIDPYLPGSLKKYADKHKPKRKK